MTWPQMENGYGHLEVVESILLFSGEREALVNLGIVLALMWHLSDGWIPIVKGKQNLFVNRVICFSRLVFPCSSKNIVFNFQIRRFHCGQYGMAR